MFTITIVRLHRIKSLRGLRAGGRARATAGAKWVGDAPSMVAVYAAQPISRRESGHRRHSTVILPASQGEWRRCFRRLPDFIVAVLREETKQVASQRSRRAPISFLDDCELWFDITQNDYDADGLTWWQEVRERAPGEDAYETDPTDPSSPGWVGYYVDTELFSELQTGSPDLRTYSLRMGEYAGLGTKVISGTWDTPEQVKANIKTNYLNGMVGAVLVGDMPMAFIDEGDLPGLPSSGALTSLFYEDMDGVWTDSDGNGLYNMPLNNINLARENDPEIFIGLLRPPTDKVDVNSMAFYLKQYFIKSIKYTQGQLVDTDRVGFIEGGSNLDGAGIKADLGGVYSPFIENDLNSLYSSHYLNPSKQGAITVLVAPINEGSSVLEPENFDFCVIQGHSDFDYLSYDMTVDILSSTEIELLELTVPFTLMTCCRTTRFIECDYTENVDINGKYYIAGYFAFDDNGWGLGAFGYSSVAGGGVPGRSGLFNSLNEGKIIGHSIISWGECWSANPIGDYTIATEGGVGNYYEHYYLNFIGDPLLKT